MTSNFLSVFNDQARRSSQKIAVKFLEDRRSYSDVLRVSRHISSTLVSNGVLSGTTVAIIVNRSADLPSYLLGILASGAAYLPIDPKFPRERILYILGDAGVKTALVEEEYVSLCVELGIRPIVAAWAMEGLPSEASGSANIEPSLGVGIAPDDIAYIIYTSGSTGKPKGVVIDHSNVLNFLLSMASVPECTHEDTLLAVTTISFDIHVLEIFLPLLVGATVVLLGDQDACNASKLAQAIDLNAVNVMQATPSTWGLLIAEDWRPKGRFKALVGGESLPKILALELCSRVDELWNMYGPTETTVWSTCHKVDSRDDDIYIGRPILNTELMIVDEQLNCVADGEQGELLIGGLGVAREYFHREALTDERFIYLPSNIESSCPELSARRFYRTGDVAKKVAASGIYQHLGRLDSQVKIRGYRVELQEIEKHVEYYDGVSQVVVEVVDLTEPNQTASQDGKALVAMVQSHEKLNFLELRHWLVDKLPGYMVPHYFFSSPEFPLTPNLKIDRNRIREIALEKCKALSQQRSASSELPENEFVKSLVLIWRKVLGNSDIAMDDRYSEVGGDSIRIFHLIDEVKKSMGVELSHERFALDPSPQEIYESLDVEAIQSSCHVVPLQPSGDKTPIYMLCGVSLYQTLANEFIGEHPVYGVYAHSELTFMASILAGKVPSLDVMELAHTFAQAIHRQATSSHVALLGFSFGGLVALETANILRSMGMNVSQVFLLDTVMPNAVRKSLFKVARKFVNRLCTPRTDNCVEVDVDMDKRVDLTKNDTGFKQGDFILNDYAAQKVRDRIYDAACATYIKQRRKCEGKVVLVKAMNNELLEYNVVDKDYGLGVLLSEPLQSVYKLGGAHAELLSREGVPELSSILNCEL